MASNNRKWFWAVVLAGVLSLAAMFAAKQCAMKAAWWTAAAAQATHDGAGGGDDFKILVSRYLLYLGILDTMSLVFIALLLAAWVVSHFKGERASDIVLLTMVLALCLFYFVTV